jgi:hypothetical protein
MFVVGATNTAIGARDIWIAAHHIGIGSRFGEIRTEQIGLRK